MARKLVLWCAVAAFVSAAGIARADVSPGDKITDANMAKAKDLGSPGMEWSLPCATMTAVKALLSPALGCCINGGWRLPIPEARGVEGRTASKRPATKSAS